jgi:aminoglycoside 3-N-acetyltransferase
MEVAMHSEASLARDLETLGVKRGGVLVVHSGFKAFGPVEGGPRGVVEALRIAVGAEGTLLAPTFTTQLTDPASWPVPSPAEERARILAELPFFDPGSSPPHKMGAVAAALWRTPGALRSDHPVTSWVALGPRAEELTRDHPREDPEGIEGPVGRAYRADAQVLLLGVEHDADTTLHLAECLLEMPHLFALPDRYPTRELDGTRSFRAVTKTTKCSDGFVKIDPHLESVTRKGRVGDAASRLLRARAIVRVAVGLLAREPAALLCDDPECVHCPISRALLAGWRPESLPTLFD